MHTYGYFVCLDSLVYMFSITAQLLSVCDSSDTTTLTTNATIEELNRLRKYSLRLQWDSSGGMNDITKGTLFTVFQTWV